ncbi:MAG: hypothetical protein ACOCRX_06830 [Candidatus Woesearchaeota archaeon]
MHSDWCGKECSECEDRCSLDSKIPCSPDCVHIDPNTDTPMSLECLTCDAILAEEKDEIADCLKREGIVICPECNRGKIVKRDFYENIKTYDIENENVLLKGKMISNDEGDVVDEWYECLTCYSRFSVDLGSTTLDSMVLVRKGRKIEEESETDTKGVS